MSRVDLTPDDSSPDFPEVSFNTPPVVETGVRSPVVETDVRSPVVETDVRSPVVETGVRSGLPSTLTHTSSTYRQV